MSQETSNSPPNNGQEKSNKKNFIKDIPTSVMVIAVLAVFVVIIVAVVKGRRIDIWGKFVIDQPQDKNALSASEFNKIFPNYFDSQCNKEQSIEIIRQLIKKVDEVENMKKIIYYKIAMAELMIPRYGNSINTKIDDLDMIEAYEKIQVALKAINFYEGQIDGDQKKTNKALIDFQTSYNKKYKKDIIPIDELGYFGFYTCFAIGKWSRQQPAEAQALMNIDSEKRHFYRAAR